MLKVIRNDLGEAQAHCPPLVGWMRYLSCASVNTFRLVSVKASSAYNLNILFKQTRECMQVHHGEQSQQRSGPQFIRRCLSDVSMYSKQRTTKGCSAGWREHTGQLDCPLGASEQSSLTLTSKDKQ